MMTPRLCGGAIAGALLLGPVLPAQAGPAAGQGMLTSAANADVTALPNLAAIVAGSGYGMKCDGSTDDTAALQNAVNAAEQLAFPSTTNGGAVLELPPGFCTIFGPINITLGLTIRGAGTGYGAGTGNSGGTVIRTGSATADVFAVATDDAVIFENVSIDSSVTKTAGAGISITGGSGATANLHSMIRGVRIADMYDDLRLNNAFSWKINDGWFTDFRHDGVLLTASSTFADGSGGGQSIKGTTIWAQNTGAVANAAFEVQGGGDIEFIGNKTLSSPYGVLLNLQQGPTGTLLIEGNSMEQHKTADIALTQGVSAKEYGNVAIIGNEISNLSGAASLGDVYVGTGTPNTAPKWVRNIAVRGNVFNDAGATAIAMVDLEDGDQITVGGNVFNNNAVSGEYGIKIGSAATHVVIENNNPGSLPSGLFAPASVWTNATNAATPAPSLAYNGAFRFDQANEGNAVTAITAASYCIDEWKLQASFTGGQVMSCQRTTDAPPGASNSLTATVTTAGTTASTDYARLQQPVISDVIAALAYGSANGQASVLSWWAKSSVAGTFSLHFANTANNRSYAGSCTLAANAWTRCALAIPADTTGTWVETGQASAGELDFMLSAGSARNTATANTWDSGGNKLAIATQTNLTETLNATFELSNVKWEIGSLPTAFVPLPYGTGLREVQRFYAKTFAQGTKPAQNAGLGGAVCGAAASATAGTFGVMWRFPEELRASPTLTTYNPSAANANWRDVTGASDATVSVDPASAKGTTAVEIAEQTTALTAAHTLCIHATADARL